MRTDAVRNRARILDAAREQIARGGPDVGIDEIAAAAGVAVGTVYRHFANKGDLLRAAVDESIIEMAQQAEEANERVAQGASAGAELQMLFRAFAEKHATDRAVKEASASLGNPVSTDVSSYGPDTAAGRAAAALQKLLDAAQAEGAVRVDVSLQDVAALLNGVPGLEVDQASRERYVDVILRGLSA